jgi:hypothetical protein
MSWNRRPIDAQREKEVDCLHPVLAGLGRNGRIWQGIAGMRGSMSWFGYFDRRKRELAEELRAHLEMDVRDRMETRRAGAEARAAAMRELGNVGLIGT